MARPITLTTECCNPTKTSIGIKQVAMAVVVFVVAAVVVVTAVAASLLLEVHCLPVSVDCLGKWIH